MFCSLKTIFQHQKIFKTHEPIQKDCNSYINDTLNRGKGFKEKSKNGDDNSGGSFSSSMYNFWQVIRDVIRTKYKRNKSTCQTKENNLHRHHDNKL